MHMHTLRLGVLATPLIIVLATPLIIVLAIHTIDSLVLYRNLISVVIGLHLFVVLFVDYLAIFFLARTIVIYCTLS